MTITVGLPFLRTSPAHGVAHDIAGKNAAKLTRFQLAYQIGLAIWHHLNGK